MPVCAIVAAVRVIELSDDRCGLEAFVVVDHDLFPVAAGGTRMLPDVDLPEVARLARAMTWKLAACRVPYAGAKAGVRFAGGDRAAVFAAYRRALEPYREIFLSGPDMGTSPFDFLEDVHGPPPLWARSHEGLGMTELATGHGVKAAAEAALGHLGRSLRGAAVAVEGFGKVGAGTARACVRAGARLVAVSTLHGLLADQDGLDVQDLLAQRERHGDRLVEHGPRPVRSRDALCEVDCDVLVPGARPDSITPDLAARVCCAVLAPCANAPYAPGAVEVLHGRGILAVPDFLANSGGVHLYDTVRPDHEPAAALAAIEAAVRESVTLSLRTSEELAITPYAAALRDAHEYLARTTCAPDELLDELFSPCRVATAAPVPPGAWRTQ